jgi:peptide/histidine transporter 3/4
LSLLALGYGGVRGSLAPLGADQFDQNDPKEAKTLTTYFNWLFLATVVGAFFGVTAVVYVSTEVKWFWGFLISTLFTFIGFVVLAIGKRFYRLQPPGDGPLVRIAQVLFVAIKNRNVRLPDKSDELYELSEKERAVAVEERIPHTSQFRWLDKAAILNKDKQPILWEICSVTQVEEVKVLTRMLPILFSTIIMNTCLAQLQTFSIEQGYFMNPYLGKLKVPAPSIPVIPIIFMLFLIPLYEYTFVPLARKFTHHPSGITQLQRVGVGLVLSAISMAVAGVIELKRRNEANKIPPHNISLFWLSFQFGIFGIADMFTLVGLLEFFYKEAPVGMRSLSTSFTWLSLSFGYFLSSIFVTVINSVTKRVTPSKLGWLHGQNLNQNNVNLFYWFLAIVSCLNFLNYLYWASWYKYKQQKPDADLQRESETAIFSKEESKQDIVETNGDQTEDVKKEDKASSIGPTTDEEATENKSQQVDYKE